jgi:hypothetical protein
MTLPVVYQILLITEHFLSSTGITEPQWWGTLEAAVRFLPAACSPSMTSGLSTSTLMFLKSAQMAKKSKIMPLRVRLDQGILDIVDTF